MIEETEFSIHKFDTKIFESIYDIQNNKVLHTNKDGEIIITILKYSLNTSEIKTYISYKTEFNISIHNNPKFFNIDVFGDNSVLVKENSEIIMIEKDDNYFIYEIFLANDKKSEILFELAKKSLNKVFGYNKVYVGNKEKYYFLFFEVNYNFMVYESNSKCIEINDKKIHLYVISYFENTLFLSILYENNLLEVYQYSNEISQTASMSKFKKIIELNLMSKRNIKCIRLLSFKNYLIFIGTNNNVFIYEILRRKDVYMMSLFSYILTEKGSEIDNTIVQGKLLNFSFIPYSDVLFIFTLNDDILKIHFMDFLQSKKLGTLETIKLDKPVSTFEVLRIGLTEFLLIFTELYSKDIFFLNYDIGIYLNSHDYTFNNYKYNYVWKNSFLYKNYDFGIEYEKIEEQFNKKIEAVTFNKKVKSSGYGKPNENMKYLSKKSKGGSTNTIAVKIEKGLNASKNVHSGIINKIAINFKNNLFGTCSNDKNISLNKVNLKDVNNLIKVKSTLINNSCVKDIAFSSDCENLIGCSDEFVKLWKLEDKERKLIFEIKDLKDYKIDTIQSNICQFYLKDKYIVFNSKNNLVFLEYELTEKKYKNNDILRAKTKGIYNVANVFEYKNSQNITYFNAVNCNSSTQVLISGSNKEISIYDTYAGKVVHTYEETHFKEIYYLNFFNYNSPSEHDYHTNFFYSIGSDNQVNFWDVRISNSIFAINVTTTSAYNMIGDISPNKLAFTIPSENGHINTYDFRKLTAAPLKVKIPKPDDLITQTKYFNDSLFLGGSLSGNLHLFKI